MNPFDFIQEDGDTSTIYAKVFQIQQMNLSVAKNARNPHFKNRYADVNEVIGVLKPALNEVKLCLTFTQVQDYLIACVSDPETGASISYAYPSKSEASKAQDVGSGQTYGRRYWQINYFNLEADDDDGNVASGVTQTYQAATPIGATKVKKKVEIGSAAHTELKSELEKGEKSKYKTVADIRNDYEVSDQIIGAIQKSFTFIK